MFFLRHTVDVDCIIEEQYRHCIVAYVPTLILSLTNSNTDHNPNITCRFHSGSLLGSLFYNTVKML